MLCTSFCGTGQMLAWAEACMDGSLRHMDRCVGISLPQAAIPKERAAAIAAMSAAHDQGRCKPCLYFAFKAALLVQKHLQTCIREGISCESIKVHQAAVYRFACAARGG